MPPLLLHRQLHGGPPLLRGPDQGHRLLDAGNHAVHDGHALVNQEGEGYASRLQLCADAARPLPPPDLLIVPEGRINGARRLPAAAEEEFEHFQDRHHALRTQHTPPPFPGRSAGSAKGMRSRHVAGSARQPGPLTILSSIVPRPQMYPSQMRPAKGGSVHVSGLSTGTTSRSGGGRGPGVGAHSTGASTAPAVRT